MKTSNPQVKKSILKLKKLYAAFLILSMLLPFSACNSSETTKLKEAFPSAGCEAAWAAEPAKEFVNLLVEATTGGLDVWEGYQLGDGAIVLNAGKSDTGAECLGIWKQGRAVDFTTLTEAPKLSTPLYGYYLNYGDLKTDADTAFISAFEQPTSVASWLEENNVNTAVVMPVEFPDFPFKIPALTKTQLAIHESFHVEVQLRYWFTAKGKWPVWDLQPDRPGLQACYNENEEVKAAIKKEQQVLSEMIEALLDLDKDKACELGNSFLQTRTARYDLLDHVSVMQNDESLGGCASSEAIMEQEEGGADYASWTKLYELGLASREKLIRRYRAIQAEPFYLTGAMMFHAISLMQPDNLEGIINEIAKSKTVDEGSLTMIFDRTLKAYCQ